MFEVLIQQAAISLIFKQITIDTLMVQLGDIITIWEADTIIGKAHTDTIVTLDERISKLRLAYPLNSKWR
jgi:UDP-2,3-diacylglucosamine pyrophosphatase LpxH